MKRYSIRKNGKVVKSFDFFSDLEKYYDNMKSHEDVGVTDNHCGINVRMTL